MKLKTILIASVLSLALSGCGAMGANTSMYSSHQPVVERTNYAIDVNLNGGAGIAPTEERRVAEWFDALKLGYGDRIAIDFGDAYGDNTTKNTVAELASRYGMMLVDTPPVTAGQIFPGTARIVVTRSKASVPTCNDWHKTTEANYNSSLSSNYGCATNGNLAAMIADPEDLVRGREDNKRDASNGNSAINAQRAKRTGGQP